MMRFAVGDNVVYDGRQCLVRHIDKEGLAHLLTSDGDYVTVAPEFVTGVYWE